MTNPDLELVSTEHVKHVGLCFHCRLPIDFLCAAWCGCVARERTFLCPSCGGCACEASLSQHNTFWVAAPPAIWDRRRAEQNTSVTRLQTLDPATVQRPLALIVDDDPIVLAIADRALQAMGFTTLTTRNAEEAQELANTMVPELLLTDALMPHMDGRELARSLKSAPRTRDIKIIVMSALSRHGLPQRSLPPISGRRIPAQARQARRPSRRRLAAPAPTGTDPFTL